MSEEPGASATDARPPAGDRRRRPARRRCRRRAAPASPVAAAAADPTTASPTPAAPAGAGGAPPPTSPVAGSTGGTSGGRNALIIGAVILAAAIIVGALVISQGGGASPSPSPAPSAAPTEPATAAPTATAEPTADADPHAHARTPARRRTWRRSRPARSRSAPTTRPTRRTSRPATAATRRPGTTEFSGDPDDRRGLRERRRLRRRRRARLRRRTRSPGSSSRSTTRIAPGAKPFDFYITQVSYKPERAAAVDLSDGYYDVNQSLVALEGQPARRGDDDRRPQGLQVRRPGRARRATTRSSTRHQAGPRSRASTTRNDAAIEALKNKQIDGLVVDLPTAFYVTARPDRDNGVDRRPVRSRPAPSRSTSASSWPRTARSPPASTRRSRR